MIDTLKFVKAAVDRTGHNPILRHFRIKNGTVTANNGRLIIQAPIPSGDIDCCPHAEQFAKAIAACDDVVSMHLDAGRLVVRSGNFKCFVPTCDPARFPVSYPEGSRFPIPEPILPILRKLLPFVSTDENKKWACGVQFANNSAMATNSICIVEHWMPVAFPVIVNLPREAIVELLRVKVEPLSLQVSPHSVTFHLPEGAFITASTIKYEWPDVQRVFAMAEAYTGKLYTAQEVETILREVAKLETFTAEDKAIFFHSGTVATTAPGIPGTSIDCPLAPRSGSFRSDQLGALTGLVDGVGFDAYPSPVPFYGGDRLRGVICGYLAQS